VPDCLTVLRFSVLTTAFVATILTEFVALSD